MNPLSLVRDIAFCIRNADKPLDVRFQRLPGDGWRWHYSPGEDAGLQAFCAAYDRIPRVVRWVLHRLHLV